MIRILPGEQWTRQTDAGGVNLYMYNFLITDSDDLTNLPTFEAAGITETDGAVLEKCACGSKAHYVDADGALHLYELQNSDTWLEYAHRAIDVTPVTP